MKHVLGINASVLGVVWLVPLKEALSIALLLASIIYTVFRIRHEWKKRNL